MLDQPPLLADARSEFGAAEGFPWLLPGFIDDTGFSGFSGREAVSYTHLTLPTIYSV